MPPAKETEDSSGFADHFAPVAASYANFRPTYPAELFAWLAQISPSTDLVWDCAAGSGQASLDLASYFERVVATDASQSQIDAAVPHTKVAYSVAPAEASGLTAACADLITVAQALHWFDLPRFYAEVRRVLKPEGVLAVWTYGIQTLDHPSLNALVQRFYHETVGAYWPPERRHVESGYRTLPFPFAEITPPPFHMHTNWTLPELLGYFRSWSATARYIAACRHDPVTRLVPEMAALWGDPQTRRAVKWPLSLRVGHL